MHISVSQRIEKLRSLSEDLRQWPPSEEMIAVAMGIWLDYPCQYFGSLRKEGERATQWIRDMVNSVHEAATWLLMQLAEQRGLDPGPLYKASVVCRQLYAFDPLREVPGKTPSIWPDILGPRRDELPQGQREAIDEGELVFQRLRVALALASATPTTAYLGIVLGTRKATRVVNDVEQTADFGRKLKAWDMFKLLVEAGADGMQKNELINSLGLQEKSEDALRGHKTTVNDIVLGTLRVEIDADGKGVWKIITVD